MIKMRSGDSRNLILRAASMLPLMGLASSVFAQDATTLDTIPVSQAPASQVEAIAPAPAAHGIEEIVVTAQKREENIQNVPIAISAFTGDQLEATGTATTKDLGLVTPGLQVTELAGFTLIFLRGVGSDIFVPSADPSIATYIDGIYVAPGQGFSQELGGVERVEVLKGPQGTLFGRNSTGGAISITTKKPGNQLEGTVSSSYGSFNKESSKVYVNIPVADSFAFSVAGLYGTGDSYYERIGPFASQGLPSDYAKAGRVRLRWNATDDIEVLLTAQRAEQENSASLISANHYPSALMQTLLLTPSVPPGTAKDDQYQDYKSAVNTNPLSGASQRQLYGSITWTLPWLDLKLLGSDQYVTGKNQTDFDGTSRALVSFYSPNLFTDVQTLELQALSNSSSPGSDWLTWVAGLYAFKSNGGFKPVALQVADTLVQLPTGQLVNLIPQGVLNLPLVGGILGSVPAPSSITLWLTGLLKTDSLAGYTQATAKFSNWVSITAGGRYQKEKRTQTESTVNLRNVAGGLTQINGYAPQSATVSNFSPKISFDFHFDDVLVYISAARGFKSQTYNIINIYTPPDYVKPEQVTSYELGLKSTLLDRTLRFNAAVFNNKTKNLQSSFVSLLAGGAVNFQTAGGARTRGAEFDLTWLPFSELDSGFTVLLGGSYLDGKYTSFDQCSGFNQLGFYSANNNCAGNKVVRTPKFSGNLSLSQTFNWDWGSIEMAADGYYNSGFYFLPTNTAISKESSYGLLNGRIGVFYRPWSLRMTVFGDNLLDERYNISQFHTDFGRLDTLAPPRTGGVRLNWDF